MAAELHSDLQIELDRPVDVFGAINQLGLVLAFAPLGPVSGMYLPSGRSRGILLHQGHPRTRQRYTAGHELGHHVFEHPKAMSDLDLEEELQREGVDRWPDHEKEAEAFGAWFLMPRRLMRYGLGELGLEQPQDPFDAYALSLWLGTSYTATVRQLATTKIIDRPLADSWAKIAPARLKKALAGSLAPDDLHNDVWWLDSHSHQHPVDARPGDRLVLTLPETVSSGFSWRFTALPNAIRLLADSFEDEWEPQLTLNPDAAFNGGDELVGSVSPRAFVFEVDPEADAGVQHLALIKDQAWEQGPASAEFELPISINPSLHGVQLPEAEFAVAGGSF
jgi:hypothetical protein